MTVVKPLYLELIFTNVVSYDIGMFANENNIELKYNRRLVHYFCLWVNT